MELRERIIQEGIEITPRVESVIKQYERDIAVKKLVSEEWFIYYLKQEFALTAKKDG